MWIGLVGSVLVALGATSDGFSFNPDGWGVGAIARLARVIDRSTGNLLIALGCVVLSLGWMLLVPRPGRPTPARLWLIWSVPLLVVPPVMSGDPFLYADLGWILHQGGNPYVDLMGSMGGPFAPFIDTFWAATGSPIRRSRSK